jgi:hypothetical protein
MEDIDIGLIIGIASLIVGILSFFLVSKKNSINIKMKNKNGDNTISNSEIINEKEEK